MHAGGVAVLSQLYMAAGGGLGVGGWGVGGLGVGAGGGVGGVGAGGGVGGAGAVQFTLAQHFSPGAVHVLSWPSGHLFAHLLAAS